MPRDKVTFQFTKNESIKFAATLAKRETRDRLSKELGRQGSRIAGKAIDIITDKGHVVTGNLRGSIKASGVIDRISELVVAVGTSVSYAPQIEALPDGGYLFPAFAQKAEEVKNALRLELLKIVTELNIRKPPL